MCSTVVAASDCPESFLTCSVPLHVQNKCNHQPYRNTSEKQKVHAYNIMEMNQGSNRNPSTKAKTQRKVCERP